MLVKIKKQKKIKRGVSRQIDLNLQLAYKSLGYDDIESLNREVKLPDHLTPAPQSKSKFIGRPPIPEKRRPLS